MSEANHYHLTIEPEEAGERMDKLLALYLPEVSRSFLVRMVEKGCVKVNGRVETSKKIKLHGGDDVDITVEEPQTLAVEPENIPLAIVYEDNDVMVVNKPKGMVVHPGPGNWTGTLVNAVMYHCGDSLSSINGVIRPGIVHRIDKDTSGLLMIAKNDMAHRCLADQLMRHSITRAYQCIVYGGFHEEEGTVDAPIGRDPANRLRQAVTDHHGRRAVTHYKVLERLGKHTLLEARLETGRTHQIRVHMRHIGHPLVGDPLYGPKKDRLGVQGQVLHAYLLGFIHPATKEYMEFTAPRPEAFEKLLQRLRQHK
ncbi:MAG: RluA family pseudouridine synthase [Eubacteriales bacterium]|nr:RluA family pseudouridine synthase [Eubacteriales bacterium]